MIKKIIIIIIITMIMTSCDRLLSFLISPAYYIPAVKTAWTVDMANSRIVGDSLYYNSDDNIWQLNWVPDTLRFQDYSGDSSVSTEEFPFEMRDYDRIDSPLFYLKLLFAFDAGGGFGIDILGPVPMTPLQIDLGESNDSNIDVDYSMTATNTLAGSYTLPEPAWLGIDGSGTTTELTGGLNILDFVITANHDFVTGQATCVFSNTDPAGLLYMVYYHSNGLISLFYAHDVSRTGALNYFPDGHYEYIWSVFGKD